MLKNWWTRDTALHSYVFCQFLIGIPFAVFNTYVIYQLQVVGYLIGTDKQGQPCTTYCIVPWGNTRLDLNSVLLYLNALAFGLGGACSLFLCAYSDYWARKHLLVSFFIICYGTFSIPVYWLQGHDSHDFATLIALYVLFNIVTLILIAVLNIYIPYCMRQNYKEGAALQCDREVLPGCPRPHAYKVQNAPDPPTSIHSRLTQPRARKGDTPSTCLSSVASPSR